MKFYRIPRIIIMHVLVVVTTGGCMTITPAERAEIESLNKLLYRATNCIEHEVVELDDGISHLDNISKSIMDRCQQHCLSHARAYAEYKGKAFNREDSINKWTEFSQNTVSDLRVEAQKKGIKNKHNIGDWIYLESETNDYISYLMVNLSDNSPNKLVIMCNEIMIPSSEFSDIPFIWMDIKDRDIGRNYIKKNSKTGYHRVFSQVLSDGKSSKTDYINLIFWTLKEGENRLAIPGKYIHSFIEKLKASNRIKVYVTDEHSPIEFNIKGLSEGVKKLEESCSTFHVTGEE